MLVRAREKAQSQRSDSRRSVTFLEADALNLPFARRNFRPGHHRLRLPQSRKLRRRPGRNPPHPPPRRRHRHPRILRARRAIFGPLYRFYFHRVLPRIGGIVSGSSQAYGYLPNSVARFPRPPN